jgi:hypothetical protein
MSKYHNKKTIVEGYAFDSLAERNRYQQLMLLVRNEDIHSLEIHPKFPVNVNNKHICNYFADFRYYDVQAEKFIVEDVKGVRTTTYRLKKKLVEAIYGIEIVEIS